MLDEIRHAQLHLLFSHDLLKHDARFDWCQKAFHTNQWGIIAIRSFCDDWLLNANCVDAALAAHRRRGREPNRLGGSHVIVANLGTPATQLESGSCPCGDFAPTNSENVGSQFLSLRQSLRDQPSLLRFGALKSPITTGVARKPPHCDTLAQTRISFSRPVCLQTSRLPGSSTEPCKRLI
jgi:hypothetical protein